MWRCVCKEMCAKLEVYDDICVCMKEMYVYMEKDVCACGERCVCMWRKMCVHVEKDVCACGERCVCMDIYIYVCVCVCVCVC